MLSTFSNSLLLTTIMSMLYSDNDLHRSDSNLLGRDDRDVQLICLVAPFLQCY